MWVTEPGANRPERVYGVPNDHYKAIFTKADFSSAEWVLL